jgi:hypothetical protein
VRTDFVTFSGAAQALTADAGLGVLSAPAFHAGRPQALRLTFS